MSGSSEGRILAAIGELRTDFTSALTTLRTDVTAEIANLRADLMERMNRLQHRMDSFDEHLTMGLGHTDRVEQTTRSVAEDNRLAGEQIRTLTKLVRMLEGRVNQLEDKR